MHMWLYIPSDKHITIFIYRRVYSIIYRCSITTYSVTIKLCAVWILEDDDRGRDDFKIVRNFRNAMLVVFASAWEYECSWFIYTIDPIISCINFIIQRHYSYFDVVQIFTSIEHIGITIFFQLFGRQIRCFCQRRTSLKHFIVAIVC